MIGNKIEGQLKSFAGLSPKREADQRNKYTRIYQEKGCEGLDNQRFWETGKELSFGALAGFLAGIGIYALTEAFEHGSLIGVIAGAGTLLLSLRLIKSTIRADDNHRILSELPAY